MELLIVGRLNPLNIHDSFRSRVQIKTFIRHVLLANTGSAYESIIKSPYLVISNWIFTEVRNELLNESSTWPIHIFNSHNAHH